MSKRERDEQEERQLDRVFAAISDPVRRQILEKLESGALLVSELAQPFDISLQAVSRHIQVLEEAGLIQKERTGRISRCSLELMPMLKAAVWINRYSKYWQDQFDLLAATLRQVDEQASARKVMPSRVRAAAARRKSARR